MNGLPTNSPALLDSPSFQGSRSMGRLLRAMPSSTGEEMEQVLHYIPNQRENRWGYGRQKGMGKLIHFKYKHFSDAFEIHILNAKENEQKKQQLKKKKKKQQLSF